MTRTNLKSVSIAPDHNTPTLSKGQKAYNTLIRQIENRRARLSAWDAVGPAERVNDFASPGFMNLLCRAVVCLG